MHGGGLFSKDDVDFFTVFYSLELCVHFSWLLSLHCKILEFKSWPSEDLFFYWLLFKV